MPAQQTCLQQIVGTFLYYDRAVDPTMLPALSSLATAQTQGTQATLLTLQQFMEYCATQSDATLVYSLSNMIVHVHSNDLNCSEPQSRSRSVGHFYLGGSNYLTDPGDNGAILTLSGILQNVMSSAAEAQNAALFINAKEVAVIQTVLEEMGHPQLPTKIQTINTTACGIANDTIHQERSRTINMRFYWLPN